MALVGPAIESEMIAVDESNRFVQRLPVAAANLVATR
jgi:hypothetical protein